MALVVGLTSWNFAARRSPQEFRWVVQVIRSSDWTLRHARSVHTWLFHRTNVLRSARSLFDECIGLCALIENKELGDCCTRITNSEPLKQQKLIRPTTLVLR